MRDYEAELTALPDTYDLVRNGRPELPLASFIGETCSRPCYFVGSGGAQASCVFAASLHQTVFGAPARPLSPLAFVGVPPTVEAGVLIVSTKARNPDFRLAINHSTGGFFHPVGLLTGRSTTEFGDGDLPASLHVVSVPTSRSDGFLATNSVLAQFMTILAAYRPDLAWPSRLPSFDNIAARYVGQRTLVLHSPLTQAVAVDLETRLHEVGLSAVQVADYRTFAHGRHRGLARWRNETTILALAMPDDDRLARETISHIPPSFAQLLKLCTPLPHPLGVLDLLVQGMKIVQATAARLSIEPAESDVPRFGRALYGLDVSELLPEHSLGPIERKALAGGLLALSSEALAPYHASIEAWLTAIGQASFGGVVLDYDGTCCETRKRDQLPEASVREGLLRLVERGNALGFASGRGKSLLKLLQKWIPERYWPSVWVGLYNGGLLLKLSEELPATQPALGPLTELADRLTAEPALASATTEVRTSQLTVTPERPTALYRLASAVAEVALRPPSISVKVVASGHSVDVTLPDSGKIAVFQEVQRSAGGREVLAVGDQGQWGGNDYELLAATRWSLSVDRCSADTTRCWNMAPAGIRGPAALAGYLGKIVPEKGGTFRLGFSSAHHGILDRGSVRHRRGWA